VTAGILFLVPNRNLVYESLALRARESPAGDRILCLMTAEVGLQDVFVFGGPKSKLRSLATPYSSGRAFIYYDPVRDFYKLSDFEVIDAFSGLREGLRKIWAAGLIAELLQKTSGGGGDFPLVLRLSTDALRGLEALPEERVDYPVILFIWRLLGLLGLMPDPETCVSCGLEIDGAGPALYSERGGGFLCPNCAGESWQIGGSPDSEAYPITAGARRYLSRSTHMSFAEALRASLDASSLGGLKGLTFALARRAVDGPLATLSSGVGIL
jgi:DNA repair protein RecO (recombination protein O)